MPLLEALCCLALAAGAQEPNHARIHGRFVDALGRSVAGASVLNRVWPGVEFPVRSVADGSFEAVVDWPADHRDTWYECVVRVLGWARWNYNDKLVPGQELDLGLVRLEPGGALRGKVVLDSMPAGEAQILVVQAQKLPPEAGWRFETGAPTGPSFVSIGVKNPEYEKPVDRGRSASDGTFRIIGLPTGSYGLWARCGTSFWATTSAFEVRAGEETNVPDIVLEPLPRAYFIQGMVVDPDGAPVPSAKVTGKPTDRRRADCFSNETRSDSEGGFRLSVFPLSCGPFELQASVEDQRFEDVELAPIDAGASCLVLQLGRMRELVVHVIDSEGRPVPEFGWSSGVDLFSTRYEGDQSRPRPGGRATLRFPEKARVQLTIEVPGFEPQELDVGEDERELTVTLPRVGRPEVSGRVTHHGQPVAGAHVDLVQRDSDLVDDLIGRPESGLDYCTPGNCVTSDAQGTFRMPNEWPSYSYRARAWAKGFAPAYSSVFEGAASGLELELPDGGALEGRVRLPGNGENSGIALRAHRSDVLESMNCQVGRQFRTRTDVDGSYRFEGLARGNWLVSVELSPGQLQGLGWSEADGKTCRETPFVFEEREGAITNADLDLHQPCGSCRLRGKLTVGDQITEGYVYLLLLGPQVMRFANGGVDSEGRFELATRAPGRYRLVVHAGPGHHRYRLVTDLVTLVPGETVWERSLTLTEWKEDGVRLDHE